MDQTKQTTACPSLTLAPEQLRSVVDPQTLDFQTSAELSPIEGIIGQGRAVAALRFGLSIYDDGFHIYVAGPPGIGKMTAVRAFIEELAHSKPTPQDWCYVNNFDDPYQPKICRVPAGRGRRIQQDMRSLVDHVRREIPRAFESDDYGARRDAIVKQLHQQREDLLENLGQRAEHDGFVLQVTPMGVLIIPMSQGHPLSDADFQALPQATRDDLLGRRDALQEELNAVMKQGRALERTTQEQLQALDKQVALYVVGGLIDDLTEHYRDLPEIVAYLKAVQDDLLENIEPFKGGPSAQPSQPPEGISMSTAWLKELAFRKYQVNVLVDHSAPVGAPVVVDLNPSYTNLFGRIEKETQFGALIADFTQIKAGSLHQANGGYLVLPVEDLLRNPFSWDALKRALRGREIEIEEIGERLGFVATKSLRPQPIPLDVKVVLVGPPLLYYMLQSYDESFPELFKVKADFDTTMPRSPENMRDVARFAVTFCARQQLRPLDAPALAKLLEQASRLAEDQTKLSANFGMLADVVREANFWAGQEDAAQIGVTHVRRAIEEKVYRSNLIQQRIQELLTEGTLLIDTSGSRVGQVNGLSVLSLGDYEFGRPSRITASAGPGRAGIIDIEREVALGGPLHSKGVLILNGYLAQAYAQEQPLQLSARLVFEQSYEGVEGDSASSAELYALLSALAGLPIRQGIAVTGSVNQHGQIQAIGGVNQKIEGFFDVCKARGLTGDQGVLIPRSNAKHLMLREDVVEAVRAGQFHVWAIETIDEGIELLTGVRAGVRDFEGCFPDNSVNGRIARRLHEFAERLKEYPPAEKNGRLMLAH
ncbi:MAG: AAA family ATPase [Kouleothrix sp.]|nr:AAA family ATPase [Kouleothrix sp.]